MHAATTEADWYLCADDQATATGNAGSRSTEASDGGWACSTVLHGNGPAEACACHCQSLHVGELVESSKNGIES